MPDDLQPIIPIMVLYYNALITARSPDCQLQIADCSNFLLPEP